MATYYEKHREERLKYSKKYKSLNSEKIAKYGKKWRKENPEKVRIINTKTKKKYRATLRNEVLNHYSGGDIKCNCCEERIVEFLGIDHIENNGADERKRLGISAGYHTYYYLRKAGFPKGYQVLCHNCNLAKGTYGVCPHKKI